MKISHLGWQWSKNQRTSNKNPTNNHEKSSFEWLVRVVQETPQTLQTIDISLGHPLPEVEGSLCCWRYHAFQTQCQEAPEPIWKLPHWGLGFMEPEDTIQASKGKKQPTVLPSYSVYEPQQWWTGHKNRKGLVVAWAWIPWWYPTLSYSTWNPLNEKEVKPSPGNLANFQGQRNDRSPRRTYNCHFTNPA